jgi:hypothetical protein
MKSKLMTLPQMAKAAGIELHHARYIVDRCRIQPVMRIRRYRIFDQAALGLVKREAERMQERKQQSGAATGSKKEATGRLPEPKTRRRRVWLILGSLRNWLWRLFDRAMKSFFDAFFDHYGG